MPAAHMRSRSGFWDADGGADDLFCLLGFRFEPWVELVIHDSDWDWWRLLRMFVLLPLSFPFRHGDNDGCASSLLYDSLMVVVVANASSDNDEEEQAIVETLIKNCWICISLSRLWIVTDFLSMIFWALIFYREREGERVWCYRDLLSDEEISHFMTLVLSFLDDENESSLLSSPPSSINRHFCGGDDEWQPIQPPRAVRNKAYEKKESTKRIVK